MVFRRSTSRELTAPERTAHREALLVTASWLAQRKRDGVELFVVVVHWT
jgi:hypothetical protein